MEKDRQIEKLIKENGLVTAPADFTNKVMVRISSEPERTIYKPLLGKGGRIFFLVAILSFIAVSIIYSEPTGLLAERGISLPKWNLSLQNLPEFNFSTGMLAALLAIFILIVTDTSLTHRRRII